MGTPRYWSKRGRSIRPGAMPIIIFVPKGPFTLVYEYEDTEGPGSRAGRTFVAETTATAPGRCT
jgi:hypothetical protein